eukprot:1266751-Rhodomonas_salina.5
MTLGHAVCRVPALFGEADSRRVRVLWLPSTGPRPHHHNPSSRGQGAQSICMFGGPWWEVLSVCFALHPLASRLYGLRIAT